MRRVLLTAHESRWLLDLAVAARAHLAADGIDLQFWPVGPNAAAALEQRGVPTIFTPSIYRVPAGTRRTVRRWYRVNRTRLLAGDPVAYDGIDLDDVNAYEARVRMASASRRTRIDLGRSAAGHVELFRRHIATFRPHLLILWWGEWAWARAGAAAARQAGVPVLFYERGPFAGSAQLDACGANGGASIADPATWQSVRPAALDADARGTIDEFLRAFTGGGATTRPQPARASREELARANDLPAGRDWLFFPAQETTDAVAAIEELTPALLARPDLTLVVKPHPAEMPRADRLTRALAPLAGQSRLVRDAHVHDLIASSAWVVTVSSAVGLEAALFGRPVLTLRRALYMGKGFTWDAADYPSCGAAIEALTSERALSPERGKARDLFLHYLLTEFLLWGTPDRLGASAREMGDRIGRAMGHASAGDVVVVPPGGWRTSASRWLSARDAYRDIRTRVRAHGRWRRPTDADS